MRNYMLATIGCLLLLSGCTHNAPPAPVSTITPAVEPKEPAPKSVANDNISLPQATVPPVPSDW